MQIKIEPKVAGGILGTFRLEGCALPEVSQVRGVVYFKDCLKLAVTHKTKHLLEQAPLTAVYIGAHSAKQLEVTKLHGSIWVKLSGAHAGLDWAAMDA